MPIVWIQCSSTSTMAVKILLALTVYDHNHSPLAEWVAECWFFRFGICVFLFLLPSFYAHIANWFCILIFFPNKDASSSPINSFCQTIEYESVAVKIKDDIYFIDSAKVFFMLPFSFVCSPFPFLSFQSVFLYPPFWVFFLYVIYLYGIGVILFHVCESKCEIRREYLLPNNTCIWE